MPLSAKKMCGAAGVNSSSQVSGASAKSLYPKRSYICYFHISPAIKGGGGVIERGVWEGEGRGQLLACPAGIVSACKTLLALKAKLPDKR